MAQQWYWKQDGQLHGPIETAGLNELERTGQLKPTALLWRDGLPNWLLMTQVKWPFPDPSSTATARTAPKGEATATPAPPAPAPQFPAGMPPIPRNGEESDPPQTSADLLAKYHSTRKTKGAGIKEKFTCAVEAAKKRGLALKLGHEAKSLQTAIEAQLEALGALTLTHRPATVDISQQITELSQIQDELSRKQAALESLHHTKGGGSVVKELNQEVSQLQSRQAAVMVAIGRRSLMTRPEMPGTIGPYAALDRLESSLEATQKDLKIIEDEIGSGWKTVGIRFGAMKRPIMVAGAVAGGLLILYLLWKLLVVMSFGSGLVGSGLPTESDGKRAFQELLLKSAQNRLKLLNFHKTNGQTSDYNGIPLYKMEYECEVEVTEDCYWGNYTNTSADSPDLKYFLAVQKERGLRDMESSYLKSLQKGVVKKGLRRKLSGEVNFEKAENGWRLQGEASVKSWQEPPSR